LKIEVDYDRCQALGVCESLAPHLFQVRPDGMMYAAEEDLAPGDVTLVKDAVAACPSFALRLAP
jgi:ferredoxin